MRHRGTHRDAQPYVKRTYPRPAPPPPQKPPLPDEVATLEGLLSLSPTASPTLTGLATLLSSPELEGLSCGIEDGMEPFSLQTGMDPPSLDADTCASPTPSPAKPSVSPEKGLDFLTFGSQGHLLENE